MAPLPVTRPRCSPGGSVTCIHVTCIAARADRLIPPGVRIALVGQMGHSSANAQSSKSPQFKPAKPGGFAGRAARSAEQGRLGPRELLGIRLGGHQPAPRLSTGYSSPGALGVPNCRSRQRRRGLPSGIPIMLGGGWGTSRPRQWHGTPPRAPVPRVRQHCKAARGEPSTSSATVLPRSGAEVFIAAIKQPDGTLQGRAWRVGRDGVTPPM
jgi:hypothetical protein